MRHTPPPQLDYAPPPPVHQRRVTRRVMQAIVALLTLVIVAELGARGWHRARLLYWQHRCMTLQRPAETVVFRYSPPVSWHSPEWNRFYSLYSPPGPYPGARTVFVGERNSLSGNKRLVVVEAKDDGFGNGVRFYKQLDIWGRVFVPGAVTRGPAEVTLGSSDTLLNYSTDATLDFGQKDAGDSSHFTIRFVADRQERTIDGWLRDDDSLILELRRPPASMPAP
jgi:hypothetical protein